ncbi:MAG: hypothetical protein PHH47_11270 [Gallionella sp.]|nr:hypothetical protein [Gallionella sp.]MDD4947021.1 hypothetical protein [Gallionella sp.]
MRIYLDDERKTPDGWIRVFWPDEAIALLELGMVEEISLDHDLGDDERGTGYDVILWVEEAVALRNFSPPKITVHSANSSAREKMLAGIRAIKSLVANRASRSDGNVLCVNFTRFEHDFQTTPATCSEKSATVSNEVNGDD